MKKSEIISLARKMEKLSENFTILIEARDQGNNKAQKLLNQYLCLSRDIREREKLHRECQTSRMYHQFEEPDLMEKLHGILLNADIAKFQGYIFLKRKRKGLEPFDVGQNERVIFARNWAAEIIGKYQESKD